MNLKIGLLVLVLLSVSRCLPQNSIPEFKSNASHEDSIELRKISSYIKGSDLAIVLKRHSTWWNKDAYQILKQRQGSWQLIKKPAGDVELMKNEDSIQYINIENRRGDSICNALKKNNILTMNPDALDSSCPIKIITKRKDGKGYDTAYRMTGSVDGPKYKFMIITGKYFRVLNAYDPEAYYRYYPCIIERKYFLICLDAFDYISTSAY